MNTDQAQELLEAVTDGRNQLARILELVEKIAEKVLRPGPPAEPDPETGMSPLPTVVSWRRTKQKAPDGSDLMFADIPDGAVPAYCRDCEQRVYWVLSKKGSKMMLHPDGQHHNNVCPNRDHSEPRSHRAKGPSSGQRPKPQPPARPVKPQQYDLDEYGPAAAERDEVPF